MKKTSKVLNIFSTIFCLIMIASLYIFNCINGIYFNGYTVLLLVCMLLNPIANLCKINKKIIDNPLYHLIILITTGYSSYIAINGLIIYKNNFKWPDNSNAHNLAANYFGDRFISVFIVIVLSLLLAFLFKKNKVKSNRDNSKIMMIIILITSIIPFFTQELELSMVFSLSLIMFLVVTFIKTRGINTSSDLQKYYLVIIILSVLSINPIALVLSIYMYLSLDTFGLNV